jgi:hypothetical protein
LRLRYPPDLIHNAGAKNTGQSIVKNENLSHRERLLILVCTVFLAGFLLVAFLEQAFTHLTLELTFGFHRFSQAHSLLWPKELRLLLMLQVYSYFRGARGLSFHQELQS